MSEKILFVDDDANLLASLERNLRRQFRLETALGAEAGLKKLAENGPYAVVVSDRQMPGMDGIQFLTLVRERAPDTVRLMLTGNIDLDRAVRVVNEGNIFRFLIKPCPVEVLSSVLEDALKHHRLVIAERQLLNQTLNGSVKLLTDILSVVDPKSFGRGQKLSAMITEIAETVPLPDLWEMQLAAMLSSVGQITLPPELLVKAHHDQPLSKSEEQLLLSVPAITARLLANVPRLEGVARITRYQAKCFDGSGLPADELRGEDLPAGARLLKILNDFLPLEAKGLSHLEILDELAARRGWYDPRLLAALRACFGLTAAQPGVMRVTMSLGAGDLAAGMILASDLVTKEGTLILSGGHLLNEMILERVRNFKTLYGIQEPIFVRVPQPAPGGP